MTENTYSNGIKICSKLILLDALHQTWISSEGGAEKY